MQILDSLVDGALAMPSEREGDALIGQMVRYLRTGVEPAARGVAAAYLIGVMPVLARSRARIISGSKGGSRPASKQTSKQTSSTLSNELPSKESKTSSEEEEERGKGMRDEGGKRRAARPRFRAPTPEEVEAYCAERNLAVDAERFCDFYASKGWAIGKSPMRDWRATVRNWARNARNDSKKGGESYAEYDR